MKIYDPQILVSLINTKLRDTNMSLEEIVRELDVDYKETIKELKNIEYVYDKELNRFV